MKQMQATGSTSQSKLMILANKALLKDEARYRLEQAKFGLGKADRDQCLAGIRKKNKTIGKLLGMSDAVAKVEQSSTAPISRKASKALLQYWQHADRIYTLLQAPWGCSCRRTHCAHLWLHHPRPGEADFKFLVLFTSQAATTGAQPLWQQQCLQITWIQKHLLQQSIASISGSILAVPATAATAIPAQPPPRKKKKSVKFVASTPAVSVQPANAAVTPTPNPSPCAEIKHLCQIMAACGMNATRLGALTDAVGGLQYSVFSQPEQKMRAAEISLKQILMQQKTRPLRKRTDRFQIALAIASAHLQLHSTPWARRQWESKDILFPQDINKAEHIMLDQPYISADFDDQLPAAAQKPRTTDRSFACLDIMLLELLFGMPLEDHAFWRRFDLAVHQSDPDMRVMVAKKWSDDVEDEADPESAAAVN